jgi:hypothetical protein
MPNYFLQTIQHLRQHEAVVLFDHRQPVSEANEVETTEFLTQAYHAEATDYPYTAPAFDPKAGLWAAKTVFWACQLMLHRTDAPADLAQLLPDFAEPQTASVILSADLTLRFLPDIITRLQLIDPDDALIPVLENHLKTNHYSGVRYWQTGADLDFSVVIADACLRQLYINRVIAAKNKMVAMHPALTDGIRASLGMFAADFWPDLAPEL